MEDAEILALLAQRDERALSELDVKYGSILRRIAVRFTGDPRDAEEIVSDTLYQAWDTIPPEQPKNLSAFLSAVTRRRAVGRWNQAHAQKRGGTSLHETVLEELAECIPSGESVEVDVEQRALTDAVSRYLQMLPEEMRRITVQRYVYLHSIREIADAYQISESKVKVTLLRARKRLRKALEQEGWL
ncbi:MAG TPA: RNA polymerase subunit sigma-70 [Ruminococcus sp.]|nr:RNA polymerase subunit sigma-70 [Ruminococcus sp.]